MKSQTNESDKSPPDYNGPIKPCESIIWCPMNNSNAGQSKDKIIVSSPLGGVVNPPLRGFISMCNHEMQRIKAKPHHI